MTKGGLREVFHGSRRAKMKCHRQRPFRFAGMAKPAAPRPAGSSSASPASAAAPGGNAIASTPNSPAAETMGGVEPRQAAEIVERYQISVYSFLKARLAQASEAEDLTQEVFLRFFTSGDRFDVSRETRPYLLGIARNLLRERARTLRKRNEVSWTELCVELEELLPDDDERQENLLRLLPECLDGLGDNAQQAVRMHYKRRMKLKTIGQSLKRSVGAVKLLMFRARKALKKCLDDKLGTPS